MMKFTIACVAVAAFAAPALAEGPDGSVVYKGPGEYNQIENLVAQYSARIIQNGQFVSGNCEPVCSGVADQTTYAGSRVDLVQGLQAGQGRGRDK
jgi:hypothetical protein